MSIAEKLTTVAENMPKVFEAGKQAEYDAFWESAQVGSTGAIFTYLPYAFAGCGWTDDTFKPKYDIKPVGNANGLFRQCRIRNLKQCLESCGVILDLSSVTGITGGFGYSEYLKVLPKLDFSNLVSATQVFASGAVLETIEEIKFGENTTFSQTFNNCTLLTHMIATGVIGKNGLDLHWSTKLTHESLLSIIDCLKDYSQDTSGTTWAVTIGAENLAKLTDAEKAVATQKGWTLL